MILNIILTYLTVGVMFYQLYLRDMLEAELNLMVESEEIPMESLSMLKFIMGAFVVVTWLYQLYDDNDYYDDNDDDNEIDDDELNLNYSTIK